MRARKRVVRGAIAGAVLLVLGAGALGVSLSPVFAAEQILVRGNDHLRASQVRRISGLTVGTNVLHADLEHAMTLLERNGWVSEATARRELPATIVIEVRERRPVGWTRIGGNDVIVMMDGTVMAGDSVRRLPRILGPIGSTSAVATTPAAAALGALPGSVLARVKIVSVGLDGSLILQLDRRIVVHYGPLVELEEKGLALGELLAWADDLGARVTTLDVSVPQAPTVRLATGASIPSP
jgi:cell division septal protein FtsQ